MKHLGSLYDVGIYGFGSKISMIIQSLLIVPFSMIWSQLRMKYKGTEGFDSFMTLVGSYYILIASSVSILFIFLGREVIGVASLGNQEYYASLQYLPFLLYAQIVYGSSQFFDFGIQVNNKTKYYAIACLITVIINLLANYFGIKYIGPSAAPVVKLITYTLYFFILFFVSQRLYKVYIEKRSIMVVFISVMIIAFYLLYAINASLIIRLICIICFCVLLPTLFVNKGEKEKLKSYISK